MKRFSKYITIALEAAKANNARFRLAAIAVDKNGVIRGVGINSHKSHPTMSKLAKSYGHEDQINLHAEIASILKARCEIESLIVVRLLRNGETALAKPCAICSAAIKLAGIKNVIYSNEFQSYTWEKR